jgi:hypothetical protein
MMNPSSSVQPQSFSLSFPIKEYCKNSLVSIVDKKSLVNEVTTLRRHLEAHHSVSPLYYLDYFFIWEPDLCQGKYRKWAQDANYESKLPGDIKKHKAAAEHVTRTLDRDLKEKKIKDRVVPYTDSTIINAPQNTHKKLTFLKIAQGPS